MAVDVLCIKNTNHRDWFDENDAPITKLLNEKNRLHEKLLSTDGPGRIAAEHAFKEAKSRRQCKVRHMKNRRWGETSAEIQRAYDCKDSKSLYSAIRQVYGQQPSTMVPLKSEDGSVIIKDAVGIHFTNLFDNLSATGESVINGLPQKKILTEMMADPTFDEVKSTIEKVNTGKAPGLDGIPFELLRCGGDNIATAVYTFILGVWHGDPVPQDLADAIMLPLYKGKSSKSNCGNYRGINLLEAVGKVFSKVLSNRLIKWIFLMSFQKASVVLERDGVLWT